MVDWIAFHALPAVAKLPACKDESFAVVAPKVKSFWSSSCSGITSFVQGSQSSMPCGSESTYLSGPLPAAAERRPFPA